MSHHTAKLGISSVQAGRKRVRNVKMTRKTKNKGKKGEIKKKTVISKSQKKIICILADTKFRHV
jgi:hypothetical protein